MSWFNTLRRNAFWLPLVSMLALAALLVGGCGNDSTTPTNPGGGGNNPVVTQEMAGLWSVTLTLKDCTTQQVVHTETYTDTLCVGASLGDVSGGGSGSPCTITAQGAGYRIVCDMTEPIATGCNMKTHTQLDLTYTNTTYTANGTTNVTLDPAGCVTGYPDQCLAVSVTGSRTGPVPTGACGK